MHIPSCVYCTPQIASLGFTEEEARKQNIPFKKGFFPFEANGKALAIGHGEGGIKTLFHEKTGELLGAHMIGHDVTELISNFALAQTLEATEEDFFSTVFPHPTLSEAIHEASLAAFDRGLHL